jgi:hypothetical protein
MLCHESVLQDVTETVSGWMLWAMLEHIPLVMSLRFTGTSIPAPRDL